MAIYRFRVTFEDYDDVSRDIEIRPSQSFEDFHHAIQLAVGFDASKEASFYISDDNWKKGKQIGVQADEQESEIKLGKFRMSDFIYDPHQKFLYIFDEENKWMFHIELIKILPQEEMIASYPRCVRAVNEAPKQYASASAAAIPVPEDFESDLDEDIDEDEEEEREEEVLGTDDEDIPIGEEKPVDFVDSDSDDSEEFETADGDMMDDEIGDESEDFR
ncbi:MAG: hypothetical protein DWQ44_12155 [Bacteroidetes bacterium]|nr:MAG: hypothetical protein DWQ33_07855 [Bacteroidota bacterium]REK08034.1 MAG: hypothetical protein DWQ39_00300 [Bacteroidota bacterium]REK32239.1 MAG: hypothetical protein DWQ44_12155 [Bacteroidota bacterium]REK47391.1 MAG: hypothetical protein DWQ48_12725 [Bacteroidota bacterium]